MAVDQSDFSPARIFISYSRADGRVFAEALERRLVDEADIRSWRDIRDMESGDILTQVLRGPAANSGSKPRRRMLKPC